MVAAILSQLPPRLQTLVREIETAAGSEIDVQRKPDLEFGAVANIIWGDERNGYFPNAPKMLVWYRGPGLAEADINYQDPWAVLSHELLHLWRYTVLKVPAVLAIVGIPQEITTESTRTFCSGGIEEIPEHLWIERQLQAWYGYPLRHSILASWDSVPTPPWLVDRANLYRWKLQFEWIKTELLTDDATTKQRAVAVMARVGLLESARTLTSILGLLADSPDQIGAKYGSIFALCMVLRIPLEAVRFLNRGPGSETHVPMPSNFVVPTAAGEVRFSYTPRWDYNTLIGNMNAVLMAEGQAFCLLTGAKIC